MTLSNSDGSGGRRLIAVPNNTSICWKSYLGIAVYLMSSSLDYLKNCIFSKYGGRDGGMAASDGILTHKVTLAVKLKAQ